MHEYFDTPEKLYLVLDYVEGGELFDRIVDEGNFTERDASRIVRQMTEAIQYLHDRNIVHRDLKPENILFAARENVENVLVTDFGLAKLANDGAALKTACGTPNYVAPEILLQRGYGKEVDVWSLGVRGPLISSRCVGHQQFRRACQQAQRGGGHVVTWSR
jgi:calcium/calmodulin-dependent protein kinase I